MIDTRALELITMIKRGDETIKQCEILLKMLSFLPCPKSEEEKKHFEELMEIPYKIEVLKLMQEILKTELKESYGIILNT